MREKFRRGCAFSMVGACKAEPQYPAMSQRRVAERMHRVGGGGEEGKQEELRISIRLRFTGRLKEYASGGIRNK